MSLHSHTKTGIAAQDALSEVVHTLGEAPVVLGYAPNRIVFEALSEELDLQGVYELRAFGSAAELRWLSPIGEETRAVVSGDELAPPEADGWTPLSAIEPVATIEGQYLLWGETDAGDADAQRLREGRLGAVPMPPVALSKGERVVLTAVEYIDLDEHGNAYVAAERLVALRGQKTIGERT